jgi:hypothetical protein
MVIILAIFLILFESAYEGFKTRSLDVLSEFIEGFYRLVVTSFAFLWLCDIAVPIVIDHVPVIKVLIGYILLRFAIFDVLWNLCAGMSLNYIGNTKLYDKFLQKIRSLWGIGTIWFVRFVALCVSLAFLLNYGQ